MRRPDQRWPSGRWMRLLVLVVILVSVVAEILAIRGVIDPAVNRFEQFWVVFTIVGGTVLIAALTAWSWLSAETKHAPALSDATPSRESRGSSASRTRTIGRVALIGGLGAAFAFSAWGITQSLDSVDARNDLTRADQRVRRTSAALARADQGVTSARTLLISTLVEMRARSRENFSTLVEEQIHAIDDVVQPVLGRERPSSATIDSAEDDLAQPASRLRKPFYRHLGTRRADPEVHLAALAVDRVIHSELVRLAAKERSARARQTHLRACRKVTGTEDRAEAPPGCPTTRS